MIKASITALLLLPLYAGVMLLLFNKSEKIKKNVSLAVFFVSLLAAINLFFNPHFTYSRNIFPGYALTLGLDGLSRLVLLLANTLGFLVCLYSKGYMKGKKKYFSFLLWLMGFVNLEILSTDFLSFTFAWGFCIAILYFLLRLGSAYSSRKSLAILGFSYICFITGVYLYSKITGSIVMPEGAGVLLNRPICWFAFLLLTVGALAKAGSGPFHTWIPAASETAPMPVMAILPASLDKLLGIYILCRISLDFFRFNHITSALLLIIGSLTVVFAVLMALIQKDARVLLSYHAISQAGYMVLGIGTGNPIGVIGALFHMMNHAIYKNGLFMLCGAIKRKSKTFKLDQMGGLARVMPLTFIAGLVFSLAISGIPPFNGFFSKWMIYKGVIEGALSAPNTFLRFVYIFSLVAAMFGSCLTLASFVKFIHASFLGQENTKEPVKPGETQREMLIPLLTLSGFCLLLGLFSSIFIKEYLVSYVPAGASFGSIWDGTFILASGIVLSLALFVLWSVRHLPGVRTEGSFAGGEEVEGNFNFPATEFYKTVEEHPFVSKAYRFLHLEGLDFYNILKACFSLGRKYRGKPKEATLPNPAQQPALKNS